MVSSHRITHSIVLTDARTSVSDLFLLTKIRIYSFRSCACVFQIENGNIIHPFSAAAVTTKEQQSRERNEHKENDSYPSTL